MVLGPDLCLLAHERLVRVRWVTRCRSNKKNSSHQAESFLFSFAGFQGRIHQGFFNFTMDVLPDVEDELSKHPSLKRLTIAGHSLGASPMPKSIHDTSNIETDD